MHATRPRPHLKTIFTVVGFAAGSAALCGHASTPPVTPPGVVTFSTERVVVFKDGFGLFVKEGTGFTDALGRISTPQVPDAVLGTFWATGDDRTLRSTTSSWVDGVDRHDKEIDCITTGDVLRANVGQAVTLHLEKSDVTGRIVSVLENETLVLDLTAGGRVLLPMKEVLTVSGKELSTRCKQHSEAPRHAKQLVFDFGSSAANKTVKMHMLYFAPGVRWIPSYRVDMGDSATAQLELQAEILNESEDLHDTTLDLVVGVPNLRFKDTPSPLSLETAMRNALAQSAPQLARQLMSNGNMYIDNRPQVAEVSEESSVTSLAPDLQAEAHQDLFAYTAKGITLDKGARMAIPLWSGGASQRSLYTLDLPIIRTGAGTPMYPSKAGRSASPLTLSENNIWHQLELLNASDQPWTTGAALVLQGLLPLSQELLAYTSPGARAMLPLTTAVDLRSSHEERELDRRPGALVVDKRSFTLIHKEGTLTLTSHRRESSTMCIDLHTGGKVETVSSDGRITIDQASDSDWSGVSVDARVTQHSDVKWEVTLKPGETKKLTYKLSLYE